MEENPKIQWGKSEDNPFVDKVRSRLDVERTRDPVPIMNEPSLDGPPEPSKWVVGGGLRASRAAMAGKRSGIAAYSEEGSSLEPGVNHPELDEAGRRESSEEARSRSVSPTAKEAPNPNPNPNPNPGPSPNPNRKPNPIIKTVNVKR